jgi:hypothetical protein
MRKKDGTVPSITRRCGIYRTGGVVSRWRDCGFFRAKRRRKAAALLLGSCRTDSYSTLTPLALIGASHFLISLATRPPGYCGVASLSETITAPAARAGRGRDSGLVTASPPQAGQCRPPRIPAMYRAARQPSSVISSGKWCSRSPGPFGPISQLSQNHDSMPPRM